jgi:hypothetical protein
MLLMDYLYPALLMNLFGHCTIEFCHCYVKASFSFDFISLFKCARARPWAVAAGGAAGKEVNGHANSFPLS